jgi:BMFP domain-containing protein YqiC
MLDKQFLDDLNSKIAQLLPRAGELGDDFRTALRQLVQKSFSELNVLTQEEFDSRVRALERAEQRVVELEKEMQELEQELEKVNKQSS